MSVFRIVICGLFFVTNAMAWHVVKTESEFCEISSSKQKGSGTLFEHNGSIYVISSEHVFHHRNNGVCHHVLFTDAKGEPQRKKAELLRVDWLHGLALLKIEDSSSLMDVVSFSEINSKLSQSQKGEDLFVLGVPHQNPEYEILRSQGRVLNPLSSRAFVPGVPQLLEIEKAHGEYGMSGGPVVDANDHFAGVLSHQVLSLVPGKPARVIDNIPSQGTLSNHLFAIPAPLVMEWIQHYFENQETWNLEQDLIRDTSSQVLFQKDKILFFNLAIASFERPKTSSSYNQIGGGDGVGIGGGDGVGIGGGDGVGIGGSPSSYEHHLQISLRAESQNLPTKLNPRIWELHSSFLERVQKNGPFVVEYLVKKQSGERPTKKNFHSLEEFVSEFLNNASLRPVGRALENRSTPHQIQKQGLSLLKLLNEAPHAPESRELNGFLKEIEWVARTLASEDYLIVEASDLRSLIDDPNYKEIWKSLMIWDLDRGVDLRFHLYEAYDMRRRF